MKLDQVVLKSVFPAANLLKLSTNAALSDKFITRLLRFLEKRFQGKLLLEAPAALAEAGADLWPAILAAGKIKSLGEIMNQKMPAPADEPPLFKYQTLINGQPAGTGADFLNEADALWRSLAEAIGRQLWKNSAELYGKKIVYATPGNLGKKALDIFSLAGFSEKNRLENKLLSFDKNSCFAWLEATSLPEGKNILCPAQLISHHYANSKARNPENPNGAEPLLRWPVSTGLATGRSNQEAVVKGMLEIIERDAFMIAYLNKISPPQIDLADLSEQDDDFKNILHNFRRRRLKIILLRLPTDFPVIVTAALIIDETGQAYPALTVGAKADFDVKNCLLGALAEAESLRWAMRKEADFFQNGFNPQKFNRIGRLFYWSKSENLPKIKFFLKGPVEKIALAPALDFLNLPAEENNKKLEKYYAEKFKNLRETLRQFGYSGCYLKITPREITQAGFHCAITILPQLQPMHQDERLPYFSGRRLVDLPAKLGYPAAKDFNPQPHPFP